MLQIIHQNFVGNAFSYGHKSIIDLHFLVVHGYSCACLQQISLQ